MKNKNILLTSALAGSLMFLGSNAIAQTKIDGTLVIGYKSASYDAAASQVTGKSGFGREAQLNVSNTGSLNVGGLKYAAGFALEFDGASEKATTGNISIGNENTYVDLISGDTTLTFGVDHIQNSDRSTAHFVGLNFEDLDNGDSYFQSSVGANPKEAIGLGIIQKTPIGSFSAFYVPTNGVNGNDDDLDGITDANQGGHSSINTDRASAYEIGFVGDLGVKGLNVHAFKNKEKSNAGSVNAATGLEGTNYGVSYNMGQFTVGVDKKKSTGIYSTTPAETAVERDQMTYGLAYAITPTLTLGASYAKNDISGHTTAANNNSEKAKTVSLGYNLGPVVAEIQYGTFEDLKGIAGADADVVYARFITKF
jgi:hypothetical protein